MSDGAPIRVMVADDHELVREALVGLLERQPDLRVVAQAADGAELVTRYRAHRPDVAVVDLKMPLMDGVEAIALLRREHPSARFVAVTTFDNDPDVTRAVLAGVRGFVAKGAPAGALVAAIRAVHAGGRHIPTEILERALDRSAEPPLTGREAQVLRAIGQGKSNQEIARTLDISERTVKGHVRGLLLKLGVTDRTQALIEAVKRGLLKLE